MKSILALVVAFTHFQIRADDGVKRIPMKEIKAYVETMNPDSTCMDELIKRRKQLGLKLGLTPVTTPLVSAASMYGGALSGALAAEVVRPGGMASLGYLVGGAFFGFVGGAGAISVDITKAAVQLNYVNLLIQTLGSYYMGISSERVSELHERYLRRSVRDLDQREFLSRLVELDSSGRLCDGSLIKRPAIAIGSKLAFKVARMKGLVKGIDQF
jgi:hypothetical protein